MDYEFESCNPKHGEYYLNWFERNSVRKLQNAGALF
jgi:hypothetical protein